MRGSIIFTTTYIKIIATYYTNRVDTSHMFAPAMHGALVNSFRLIKTVNECTKRTSKKIGNIRYHYKIEYPIMEKRFWYPNAKKIKLGEYLRSIKLGDRIIMAAPTNSRTLVQILEDEKMCS